MQILRPGRTTPSEKSYVGTCAKCDCQVSFVKREARYIGVVDSLRVSCPNCGADITVPLSQGSPS
jgi:hypothetical protein